MKSVLEFTLPAEYSQFKRSLNGPKYAECMENFNQFLVELEKELSEDQMDTYNKILIKWRSETLGL